MSAHWNELIAGIQKKYEIVEEIDIINIMGNPWNIFNRLQKYADFIFKPNQILTISHIDTGFYVKHCPYGINFHTLYTMISHLGLPTEHIMLLTNQDVEDEIKILSEMFNVAPFKIVKSSYNTLQTMQSYKITPIDLNVDKIEYSFICLNNIQRAARIAMLCELEERSLLEKGMVSWNFDRNEHHAAPEEIVDAPPVSNILNLLISSSGSCVNDRIIYSPRLMDSYNKHCGKFLYKRWVHPEITGRPLDRSIMWQPEFVQRAFLYLVTETVADYPVPFISEKTFKGFLLKRPMVILGAPGLLAKLKSFGFKTWGDHWNESYDNITDFSDRLLAIADIVTNISKLSQSELKEFCLKMEDTLEYNYNWYVNNFAVTELNKLIAEINV